MVGAWGEAALRVVAGVVLAVVFVGGPAWVSVCCVRGRPVPAVGVVGKARGRARWWAAAWWAAVAVAVALVLGAGLAGWSGGATAGVLALPALGVVALVVLGVRLYRDGESRRFAWSFFAVAGFLVVVGVLAGFDVPYVGVFLEVFASVAGALGVAVAGRALWRARPFQRAATGARAWRELAGPSGALTLFVQALTPVAAVAGSAVRGVLGGVCFGVCLVSLLLSLYLRSRRPRPPAAPSAEGFARP